MRDRHDIRLLDAGEGRRLERFGDRIVDRPHPAAVGSRSQIAEWRGADLRFDRGRGWTGPASQPSETTQPWVVKVAGVRMELRATTSGGVGLFPEQLQNASWLDGVIRERRVVPRGPRPDRGPAAEDRERAGSSDAPAILNLFAHTGLLTLVAARAGAAVTHVDAARSAVAWARRNAALSELDAAPIRWIVDDALEFAHREVRRDRRYEGVILDPPSYGHGGRRAFELETNLRDVLAACAAAAAEDAFVLVTAHTEGLEADGLLGEIAAAFDRPTRAFETVDLTLAAETGAELRLGTAIRSRR